MPTTSRKALCMFSGGLDSTAVVHTALTDPAYRDHTILVHHITLTNVERRHQAEVDAVERLLDYFVSELGFGREKFTHNVIDFRFMTNRLPWDMDVTCFMAAMICSQDKAIRKVLFGRNRTDLEKSYANLPGRSKRAREIFEHVLGPTGPTVGVPEFVYPNIDLTKRQVWERLPPELRGLTWSCRYPRYVQGRPTACGRCGTCREMVEAGIPVRLPLRVVEPRPGTTSPSPGSPARAPGADCDNHGSAT